MQRPAELGPLGQEAQSRDVCVCTVDEKMSLLAQGQCRPHEAPAPPHAGFFRRARGDFDL